MVTTTGTGDIAVNAGGTLLLTADGDINTSEINSGDDLFIDADIVTINEVGLTADDVIAYCRENMAHYKVPKTIVFGELPKTSTGKVQKFRLREQEWAGHDKRIK